MIIFIARVEVDPSALPRLHPVLDAMMRAAWDESGCLSYSMAVENAAAGVITVVARWTDEAALKAHENGARMAAFNLAAGDAIRMIDAKVYAVSGERRVMLGKGMTAA